MANGERQLPDGWRTMTLEDCADILDNRRRPINSEEREKRIAGKDRSELYPYYGATGQVGWIDGYLLDEEVVLLGEDGAPFLDFGKDKAYVIRGKSWVNNHAHVLKARGGMITNLFLMHYLNYFDYHGYVTGTTRLKLNQGQMRQFPVKVPLLPEQERIVARIEELFTQLEAGTVALARVQAGLRRSKASVLKAAVEGRLGADGIRPSPEPGRTPSARTGELPEGWRWMTVGEIVKVGTGATPLRSKDKYWKNGKIPWVTSGALNELFVNEANEFITEVAVKETNAKVFPAGTLLVAMYGEGKTRGKVSELMIDAATNQACAALVFDKDSEEHKPFIKLFFQNIYEDIRRLSSGGVQPNLNLSIIRNTQLPLPPLEEQRRIVAEVERRLSVARQVENSVQEALVRAVRLRQAILRSAFEGKLA